MLFSKVKDGSHAFSEREIVAQSMTFLLAGYETTSTVLAFFSHVLAHNQSVQKKLFDEVDSTIGEVNYSSSKIKQFNSETKLFEKMRQKKNPRLKLK